MGKRELTFQKHIIDSYISAGGHAMKWSSEWQAGPPDLVCTMPGFGCHLVEVKHLPSFGNKNIAINNPMTKLQQRMAQRYITGGANVYLAIIRGERTESSQITYVSPFSIRISPEECIFFDYELVKKFPIRGILMGKDLHNEH